MPVGKSAAKAVGDFRPLQADSLSDAAADLHATPMQVALAWLLQRSPNVVLTPGTTSVDHLQQNLVAAALQLPTEAIAKLDTLAATAATH
jgi:aryl-alcohol dehydrogenase-like predicted oxidoreductase